MAQKRKKNTNAGDGEFAYLSASIVAPRQAPEGVEVEALFADDIELWRAPEAPSKSEPEKDAPR